MPAKSLAFRAFLSLVLFAGFYILALTVAVVLLLLAYELIVNVRNAWDLMLSMVHRHTQLKRREKRRAR